MSGNQINLLLQRYAAATVYSAWPGKLSTKIDPVGLTLPGRGARFGQSIRWGWASLIDVSSTDVRPRLARPLTTFAHGVRALVGLERAHAISARHQKHPLWFGAFGRTAVTNMAS